MIGRVSLFLAAAAGLVVAGPAMAAAAGAVDLSQDAGGYRVELKLLPATPFYTAQQVASGHITAGMQRVGGAEPVAMDAPSHPNHDLSLSVVDDKTGRTVTDADVGLYMERFDPQGNLIGTLTSVPVVEMQAVGGGAASTRYGNNARLDPGRYRIDATVKGMDLVFFATV